MKTLCYQTCLVIVCLLFCFNGYAQGDSLTIDSLRKVLVTEKEDTNKVNTLNELCRNLLYANAYSEAIPVADEAIVLSQKNKFINGEALALRNKGWAYEMQPNTPLAREYYQKAIELFNKSGNKNAIGDVLSSITSSYNQDGNESEARKYNYEALKIFEQTGNKEGLAGCYLGLCTNSIKDGNYSEAKKYALLSLKTYNKLSDTVFTAVINSYLADILYKQGDYSGSIEKYLAALNGYGSKEQWNKAGIYLGIGNALVKQGDVIANKGIANKKYKDALMQYFSALEIYENAGSDFFSSSANISIGKLYTKLKDYFNARLHLEKSIKLSFVPSNYEMLRDGYAVLSELDSATGNYAQAFNDYKHSVAFNDSLHSDEAAKKIVQVKMQYDFDKKESVAKATQDKRDIEAKRTKNQQYLAIVALGIVVLAVLIIALIQFRNNKHRQKANALLQQQKEKVENTLSELKSTQAQLINSEKMASLGELTAGIAHEIQNPLNFVNNFSEVSNELIDEMNTELNRGDIEEAKAIAASVKQNLEKIGHHGKRADAIVKGMLQHSRSGSGVKEPTDINALTDEYLRLCYHGLRAKDKSFNAGIKTDFDESIEKINIVSQDIGRVILNLLTNAFYAVNEKRKNSQALERSEEVYDPTVSVSTKKIGDKAFISIKDNGSGIPQKVLDKIFQPFFTTKPSGQGTGLGLSLSYDTIKAHGGEIKVESKEGEGSEFLIQLPIR